MLQELKILSFKKMGLSVLCSHSALFTRYVLECKGKNTQELPLRFKWANSTEPTRRPPTHSCLSSSRGGFEEVKTENRLETTLLQMRDLKLRRSN